MREAELFLEDEFDQNTSEGIQQEHNQIGANRIRKFIYSALTSETVAAWIYYGNDRPRRLEGPLLHDQFLTLDIEHDCILLPSFFDQPCRLTISSNDLSDFVKRTKKQPPSKKQERINAKKILNTIKKTITSSKVRVTKNDLRVLLERENPKCPRRRFDELCAQAVDELGLLNYFRRGRPQKNQPK